MLVGCSENAAAALPLLTRLLELLQTTNAADEVDALVGARIVDVEQRREQMIREQAHVQPRNRIVDRNEPGMNEESIPLAGEIQAELAGAVRSHGVRRSVPH